jgi:hypothetical protein
VFVVLFVATSGIFITYKKFWKGKYERVSAPSGITAGTLKISGSQASYVK